MLSKLNTSDTMVSFNKWVCVFIFFALRASSNIFRPVYKSIAATSNLGEIGSILKITSPKKKPVQTTIKLKIPIIRESSKISLFFSLELPGTKESENASTNKLMAITININDSINVVTTYLLYNNMAVQHR